MIKYLKGKIDSVIVVEGSDEERNKEAIRIVKSIPEWSVIFWRGEQFQMTWYILVEFGNNKDEN
jgi:putative heme iron utilization protein